MKSTTTDDQVKHFIDFTRLLTKKRSAIHRYLVATLLTVGSCLVIAFLNLAVSNSLIYSVNLGSIIFIAAYSGLRAGIISALVEAFFIEYFFIEPVFSIFQSFSSYIRIVTYVIFAFFSADWVNALKNSLIRETAARKEAEAAAKSRERIVAIVSHDLRNPLSAIKMNADLITTHSREEFSQKSARIIARSSQQMDRLIYDLLDCARIDLGTFKLNVYESNITALLHEAIETMLPLANDKNVKLELTIQESLPSPHFDGPRLIQVLCNLIGNSIKFSPRNSTITLVATLEGNEIVFRIKDQGPGISPQEKKQLFETFWQKPDTAHLGIGLGLYISKKIIEAHGGRIGLENHSQVGSTFYFTIPSNQEISKLTAA